MKALKELFYAVCGIALAGGLIYVGAQLGWW
jgi:hypothetical protein